MHPHRDIDRVADRRSEIVRAPRKPRPLARLARRVPWRRIAFWLALAVAMDKWFGLLFLHFQDAYVSFILTVLPVVSAVALVRPPSDRRHHGSA